MLACLPGLKKKNLQFTFFRLLVGAHFLSILFRWRKSACVVFHFFAILFICKLAVHATKKRYFLTIFTVKICEKIPHIVSLAQNSFYMQQLRQKINSIMKFAVLKKLFNSNLGLTIVLSHFRNLIFLYTPLQFHFIKLGDQLNFLLQDFFTNCKRVSISFSFAVDIWIRDFVFSNVSSQNKK